LKKDLAKGRKVYVTSKRGKEYDGSRVNDSSPETYWTTNDYQTAGDIIY